MRPLRRLALFIRFLARRLEALEGPISAVPLTGVTAREVIPARSTEVYCERVCLRAVAVPLELVPVLELGVGTESTLYLANCPTSPVGLRRYE